MPTFIGLFLTYNRIITFIGGNSQPQTLKGLEGAKRELLDMLMNGMESREPYMGWKVGFLVDRQSGVCEWGYMDKIDICHTPPYILYI